MIYQWVGILRYDISMGGDFYVMIYQWVAIFKPWYINRWWFL